MAEETLDRNVFILGAGFSAGAGAPVVKNFLDRAREFYDNPASELTPVEREHFKTVFKFRRAMAQSREKINIDLDDIEQLFGLVEMSFRLGEIPADTRYSTVYLIAKTLQLAIKDVKRNRLDFALGGLVGKIPRLGETSVRQDSNPPMGSSDVYSFFANLIRGELDDPDRRKARKDTVITFNYDLVLDDALRRTGGVPLYHLPPALLDVSENPTPQSVSVLKLHGSTNWGICITCMKSIVVLPEKVTQSPDEFRTMKCKNCGNPAYQPLLVPPSWDKSEYSEVMKPVWKIAVDELKAATRIIIVGYSMPETDAFFKYLLTLALSENHRLYKLIVIDLGDNVNQKFQKLLVPLFRERRYYFSSAGFVSFLAQAGTYSKYLGRAEAINGQVHSY